MDSIAEVRARYAEEIGAAAGVTYQPIVAALATVPREHFLGPAPWTFPSENAASSDPARIYRNVLVALDSAKGLNNGEPSFWAGMFDHLRPEPGERVVHAGAGTGYYTALLAEMVGPSGRVTGIEYEPHLAERAVRNLAAWPNVELLSGDALQLARGPADVIVASAGFDAVPLTWVEMLNDGGRLLVPMTAPSPQLKEIGIGANLLITRRSRAFEAAFVGPVGIYHCMSGRSEEAGLRLAAALRLSEARAQGDGRPSMPAVRSLRLNGAPDDSCWLEGDGWWLSVAPP